MRWQTKRLPRLAFPLRGRWHGEAVTDEVAYYRPGAVRHPGLPSWSGATSPPLSFRPREQRDRAEKSLVQAGRQAGRRGRRPLRSGVKMPPLCKGGSKGGLPVLPPAGEGGTQRRSRKCRLREKAAFSLTCRLTATSSPAGGRTDPFRHFCQGKNATSPIATQRWRQESVPLPVLFGNGGGKKEEPPKQLP